MFGFEFIFWNVAITVAWYAYKQARKEYETMEEWCEKKHRIVDVRAYFNQPKRVYKVEYTDAEYSNDTEGRL